MTSLVRPSFFAVLILAVAGCGGGDRSAEVPASREIAAGTTDLEASRLDQEAPDTPFLLLDGRTVTLADFRGKPLVVNFWATWCGPCVREMPMLSALRDSLTSERVEILGVSLGESDSSSVRTFARNNPVSYPLADDPAYALGDAFGGVYAMPTTFIIDSKGVVRYRITGETGSREIVELLEAVEES